MELVLELAALFALIGFSALYSGSEIGFYRLSSVQVDLDAKSGSRRAQLMRWLLRDESALLITILIGNNLALELATHVAESLAGRAFGALDAGSLAVIVTLGLTPFVFLFGEALPKDVVRQRPHALTGLAAPVIALSRIAFWPLERGLRLATYALERTLGLESSPVQPPAGKDAVLGFLAEGRRHGVLSESAEALASNALRLRTLPVEEAMVPWAEVEALDPSASPAELMAQLLRSRYSRLLVVSRPEAGGGAAGPTPGAGSGPGPGSGSGAGSGAGAPGPGVPTVDAVKGYVHQLEVLHKWSSAPEDQPPDVLERVRPVPNLDRALSVDRALGQFRASGRRIGLVVDGELVLGLISVNDLLDRISDEVVG